ncbi:MAG: site-2 protease family protein [Rhodocyclaceae bacterium]|nr:site-2 protease family protein [Rhodocyclaceae bacterium]
MESLIQTLAISALPIIFAITLHEAAHGYVARYFGDPTAWKLGRISLNPLRHIDPMGTLVIPALTYWLGGFMFGWAKPVPVNFGKLRNPKRHMIWVAAAGPAANCVMAIFWAAVLKLAMFLPDFGYGTALAEMATAGIRFNAMLMVLNLLPLPPLDGGRILTGLLPVRAAWRFAQLERWGFPILILLLLTHVLELLLLPPLGLFLALLMKIFGF